MSNLEIINANGQMLTNSRNIAENFKKEHKNVISSIEKHIADLHSAEKSAQWFYESTYQDSTGRTLKEYLMNRDGFSLLVMSFNNTRDVLEWKIKYIQAFNEMEKQLTTPQIPQTLPEALRAYANEVENHIKAKALLEEQKPKVLFADSVAGSKKSILIGEQAKILKQKGIDIGQNRFFEWLREKGYLGKKTGDNYNLPTQKSMNMGLFEIKKTAINHSDGIRIERTAKITGKGQLYFVNKFLQG